MAYFRKFPLTRYDINKDENTKVVVDILRRVAFTENFRNDFNSFHEYIVKDGETPEIVSYNLYGESGFHWILLLLNEMENPYFDWPLSEESLNNVISKRYSGKAFYFTEGGLHFDKDTEVYVSSRGGTERKGTRGLVKEWDPTFKKLVLYSIEDSFLVDDIVSSTNTDGTTVTSTITRIVDIHGQAVHHFEDLIGGTASGNVLNPYGSPPDSDGLQVVVGQTGGTHDGHSYATTGATFGNSILYAYVNSNDANVTEYTAVTNYTYEHNQNQEKRSIKVLNNNVLQTVIENFEERLKI
tara:strand:+ start:7712 stop:8602 length:891 start_codon:yes stop_codon:yes gene_type:complete